MLLGSNLRDDNALLAIDLTNPDIFSDQRIVLQKDTLHIVRTIFLWRGTAYQRLGVRNFGDRAVDLRLVILFDSDFADLFEVRGLRRARRGVLTRRLAGPDQVLLSYHGLDGRTRRTRLTFDPPPAKLTVNAASYHLHVAPGAVQPMFVAVACDRPDQRPMPFLRGLLAARRELRAATIGDTTVETSNELFNEILCRSAADLAMLMTDTPQGRYPYAGIPWYSTTFGRDGLITALQMLWWNPAWRAACCGASPPTRPRSTDPRSDAQPGKILHEMRAGEMAALHEVPFGLYYGSVDSTPLFVLLAGAYVERTGDEKTLRELWPAIEAALGWIDGPGDPDRDGFIEYRRATEQGLANQGWKDSHDAIFHADGRLAEGHIALAEVQGYVFAAKRAAARCARRLGHDGAGGRSSMRRRPRSRSASRPRSGARRSETYALALDGAKQPCRVRTSNAGQVLFTGIAAPARAALVARGLMEPRFFSGWGIRTVAQRRSPLQSDVVSQRLDLAARQFAHRARPCPLRICAMRSSSCSRACSRPPPTWICAGCRSCSAAFRASAAADRRSIRSPARRRPGRARRRSRCSRPRSGWSSIPRKREIRLRNPRLPSFLDEVMLRNLRLGAASVDLHGAPPQGRDFARYSAHPGQDSDFHRLSPRGSDPHGILKQPVRDGANDTACGRELRRRFAAW